MVNKLIGYGVSLVGLAGVAFTSLPNFKTMVPSVISNLIPVKYLVIASIILVVAGVFMSFDKSGVKKFGAKQASEEVPIFEGEGKHKKIVGYRRAN